MKKFNFCALLAAAALSVLAACDEGHANETVAVTGVTVTPGTLTIVEGGTETLTAAVAPDNATLRTVTWTSDRPETASVDDDGVVTAVAPGEATITATTTDGSKTGTCTVTVQARVPDVYVTGVVVVDNCDSPVIWKNGVAEHLPKGCDTGYPVSVFVSGGDLHVSGYELDSSDYTPYAVHWKNGEYRRFGVARTNTASVYVSGGDLYIAGRTADDAWYNTPTLWKNGVAQPLPCENSAFANSVFVSDGDVYVAGYETDETYTLHALLWKNGVPQRLSEEVSSASSVFVSGGDVYVAGENGYAPTLWVNGVAELLIEQEGVASSVFVSDGEVYVAGTYYDSADNYLERAMLWKNGEGTQLSANRSSAGSVYVFRGDVYVAGVDWDPEDTSYTPFRASMWKNGVIQRLHDEVSLTYSIFVN